MTPTHDQVQYAAFLLRLALGAMFLAHSVILKLFVFTLPGTAGFFQSLGLPTRPSQRTPSAACC